MYHVVCGTYETALYGYLVNLDDETKTYGEANAAHEEDGERVCGHLDVKKIFAYSPHGGAIKAVASCDDWLVSASTDECLKAYDMKTYKELGLLTRQESQITSLEFYQKTHLFCGTDKGSILIWRVGEWEQLPSLKNHTDRINSISVHPSGVLALTTSKDKTMKLWDLTKGQVVHTNKLETQANLVQWSRNGNKYFVITNGTAAIYSNCGKKLGKVREDKSILDAKWLDENSFITGGESRLLHIWDANNFEKLYTLKGFKNRIKAVDLIERPSTTSKNSVSLIVTISSDERLRIWDIEKSVDFPVFSLCLEARLICLTCAPVPKVAQSRNQKRKRPEIKDIDIEKATSLSNDSSCSVSPKLTKTASNSLFSKLDRQLKSNMRVALKVRKLKKRARK